MRGWFPARLAAMERRRVSSGSPFEPRVGFSRAVRVGQRVLISGTAPVWPDGSCDPDPATQARRCFAIILAALAELGGRPADVVRTRTYLVDRTDWEAIGRVHGAVSYTHLRAHETVLDLVCRLLLEKKKKNT